MIGTDDSQIQPDRADSPSEWACYWRSPDQSCEQIHASFVSYRFPKHLHESFSISLVEQGAMGVDYREGACIIPSHWFGLTNPEEVHTGFAAAAGRWTFRTLYPKTDLLSTIAADLTDRPPPELYFRKLRAVNDRALVTLLLKTHQSIENPDAQLAQTSLLLLSLSHLLLRYADSPLPLRPVGVEKPAIRQVQQYLRQHYAENISIQGLAQRVNLHPVYLVRAFRQAVGLPPHGYQRQIRIERAKELLASGVALAEAAQTSGFSDQSHFHRHFKRTVGVTPKQYQLSL